jgi:prophage maintenance system killer protein
MPHKPRSEENISIRPAMAAAYLFTSLKTNRSFNGNKRVGANRAITFLLLNDLEPTFDEDALVNLVL